MRRPTPTKLKIMRGNPGKRPLPKHEPLPVGDIDNPPDWMTESQKEGFRYAVRHAPPGLLKKLDMSVFVAWVVAEDFHRQATIEVAKTGLVVNVSKKDGPPVEQQSPFLPIVNRQALLMMKAANELGFSPTARAKISVPTPEAQDEYEALDNMTGG